jgi:hypothetical protein
LNFIGYETISNGYFKDGGHMLSCIMNRHRGVPIPARCPGSEIPVAAILITAYTIF